MRNSSTGPLYRSVLYMHYFLGKHHDFEDTLSRLELFFFLNFDCEDMILQGALADIFLRGSDFVTDARGMASLVSTLPILN